MISFHCEKISGEAVPRPSKSHTHRAVFISALSGGECVISNPSLCDDVLSSLNAVRSFGANVRFIDNGVVIDGHNLHQPTETINVGGSGTTMRFMASIAAAFPWNVIIDGDSSLRKRPMYPLLNTLKSAGADCSSDNGHAPLTIKGTISSNNISIDGSVSSQFVSSLLIASPLLKKDVSVFTETSVSEGYVDVTMDVMKEFGVSVSHCNNQYLIKNQEYIPSDYEIPMDWSSASYPMVAAALGGSIVMKASSYAHPDASILDFLMKAGVNVEKDDGVVSINSESIHSIDVNLKHNPDLFPILAVLLSAAEGDSRLYGAPHLKHKESNRIASVVDMIESLGGSATPMDDGCVIHGKGRLKGGTVDCKGDHRIFMSAAIASIICDEPVVMADDGCWKASYPEFVDDMKKIGLRCSYCT